MRTNHRGPTRSRRYLQWIRSLGCAVCFRRRSEYCAIEAAHTSVLGPHPRGLGQKTSDYSAIPLCFWHHRGRSDSYHWLGEKRFAQRHQLDLEALVATLLAHYPGGV
jgi:hypothetical protein